MTTTLSIDLGIIVAALAPTLMILVTSWQQSRERRSDREKLEGIHTLVNDQMTREKAARLYDLRAQKLVLERLLSDDEITESDLIMLVEMEQRIEQLAAEIEKRDEAAADVVGFDGEEE